jgi:hypothetical protein
MTAVRHGLTLLAAALALTACAGVPGPAPKPAASPVHAPAKSAKAAKSKPAPKPHTLAIKITGSGTMALTYVVDGARTKKTIGLPWRRTIRLPAASGGHTWSVTMRQMGGSSHGLVLTDGSVVGDLSNNGGGETQVSGKLD